MKDASNVAFSILTTTSDAITRFHAASFLSHSILNQITEKCEENAGIQMRSQLLAFLSRLHCGVSCFSYGF